MAAFPSEWVAGFARNGGRFPSEYPAGFPRNTQAEGVVIEWVEFGSVAQMAGLRRGDVILEVNRQTIKDESDYLKVLEKANPKEGVLFLINRRGSVFYVVLKAEE